MQFAILGPVEAHGPDGAPVALGGPQLRGLLALLALDAGRVVSAERLIDGLHGENPPEGAAEALQSQVSRLRRRLRDGGAPDGLVEFTPAGYRLAVDPQDVDVHRFERLTARARETADPAAKLELFGEALALWRGPALDGLADPPRAARLAELRVAASEDRIEAGLALGRHERLVAELRELTGEHPLRERLAAQLMRALHGKGRSGPEERFLRRFDAYISISTVPNSFDLDRWELLHSAAPGKMVNVYSTARADDAKAAFWFTGKDLPYDRRDVDGQKNLVADQFAGLGWQIPELLDSMREADDFYFDPVCQIELDHLSAGRVTLLGDAGYCPSPASGQGTSLALVGAYVLAGELAAAGDFAVAFERYEAEMRPYIEKNQALAKSALRGIIPQSRAFAWFNTRMIKLMPYLPGRNRILEQIAAPIRDAANGLVLKDYVVAA